MLTYAGIAHVPAPRPGRARGARAAGRL